MTTLYQEAARSRSLSSVHALLRQRRGAERRARWANIWSNLKKLVAKKSWTIKLAVGCMVFGAVVAYGLIVRQGGSLDLQRHKVAFTTVVVPVIQTKPMVVATPELSIQTISTPVAASGDETVPRLKLSSQISLTVSQGISP